MSTWRGEALESMDEVDGDMGHVGMQQPRFKPGMEGGDMKDSNRSSSIIDSGLGSMASMGSFASSEFSHMSQTETLMARLAIAEKIHRESSGMDDDGYNSASIRTSTEEELKTEIAQPSPSVVEDANLCEALYAQDEDGDTKLHVAITQLSHLAPRIINMAPGIDHLNLYNKMVLTPLHIAVITNQPNIVRQLVVTGARLEVRDAEGNTPLHIACREGFLEAVKALTIPFTGSELVNAETFPMQQIPQDLDLKNYEGYTSMHLACQRRQCNTMVYLITQLHADVNARDGLSGRTSLHHAADVGDANIVNFLINICRANVNARAYSGCTPLRIAIGRQHRHVMEVLRRFGAYEPNTESSTESDYSTDDEMIDDFTIGGRPVATSTS